MAKTPEEKEAERLAKEQEEAAKLAAKEQEEEAKEDGKVSAVAVFIIDSMGNPNYVRTYSIAEHGKKFLELAKMFKGKLEKQGKTVSLKEDKR